MTTMPKVHPMIVAAGRGSRFGAPIPKQYIPIHGQTLLQHSVARLASSLYIHECLLVIADDDDTAHTLDFALPIRYTVGGAERWQSVLAGLEFIINEGALDSDLVLIHDAARPAVPHANVDTVIAAAMLEPYGAILATPVVDTLKHSHTSSQIVSTDNDANKSHNYNLKTIDRSHLWHALTPQVFRVVELKKVLSYVAKHHLPITDEASAFEYLNLPIRLVTGSRQNIKLTYPDDIGLIKAILSLP